MGTSISILDADSRLLVGGYRKKLSAKYPVELSGEGIGWVMVRRRHLL